MTDDKIALCELLEKGSDATFLREMIGFAAERLMALETATLCGAAPGERSTDRTNQRNGYRDRDWHTRAGTVELRIPPPAFHLLRRRNLCRFRPSCAAAATSRASSSRAAWPRRR